ncbi:MAG: 30S ribosomal protein S8 [Candidatus Omnitrophica bacterium]|nr:30S ribosomal protein S8 [Candidatus Omnitrophota bacterium]
MSLSDPISNMLTSIRNAVQVKKETVDVPASKISEKILEIFKEDGYIEEFRLLKDSVQGTIKIYLKYEKNKKPFIIGLKRISKPGLRVYATHDKIPRVLNGLGSAVISTSKGVMDDRQARELKVGGEVLCYIW